MQGLLLVDKPVGWTSFDVVNYIRRIVATVEGKKPKNCKVGHTGTLDPFATGLLVILVGKEYTRRAGELSKQDKTYEITMELGKASTTGDPEGEITKVAMEDPGQAALETALQKFHGEIMQVPPAFSAIKINGQRAYKLAREGKEVIIEARPVTIHRLDLVEYAFPTVKLVAEVGSGTYIRSLVEDIAAALGTSAYTTELRRTAISNSSVQDAVSPTDINGDTLERLLTK